MRGLEFSPRSDVVVRVTDHPARRRTVRVRNKPSGKKVRPVADEMWSVLTPRVALLSVYRNGRFVALDAVLMLDDGEGLSASARVFTMPLSNRTTMPLSNRTTSVCLGTAAAKIKRGEVTAEDAFWMSRFDSLSSASTTREYLGEHRILFSFVEDAAVELSRYVEDFVTRVSHEMGWKPPRRRALPSTTRASLRRAGRAGRAGRASPVLVATPDPEVVASETGHEYPARYAPTGDDSDLDRAWQVLDVLRPGVLDVSQRSLMAGMIAGMLSRARAGE